MLDYDKYIVAFSGGKDCTAAFLQLLEMGVPKEKIELWHHDIDGRGEVFMDWEVTPAYCRAFAKHFDVPIYFSWKEGGFKKEMLRNEELTAPTWFEVPREEYLDNTKLLSRQTPDGKYYFKVGGTNGKNGTRLKFPQVSADLSVRWCSSYLKIDVGSAALRNQNRFNGIRTCFISGERGEESPGRAKYKYMEIDRADNRNGKSKRHVDRIRLVKYFVESQVWFLIEKYGIRVHPAYYMGWGRVSCKFCIFGNADQFASANKVSPLQGQQIGNYEKKFQCTIKRNKSIPELISEGNPYRTITDNLIEIATSDKYDLSIIMDNWYLPAGAYGDGCGPS